MGNCCGAEDEGPSQKTPLLGSDGSGLGAHSGTLTQQPATTPAPQSARQHNPVDTVNEFEKSIKLIKTIQLKPLPIATIDKTFSDLAKLYNEVVDCFRALERDIHEFKGYFEVDTAGIPVLASCVRLLVKRCGGAAVTVERKSKTYIEINYDPKEVSNKCTGDPEQVLPPLEHFKSACRNTRDILARAPQVQSNAKIILNDEPKLRRDVQKADLSSEESVEATKSFLENVSKLRVMAAGTDTIKRDVEQKFKEFTQASKAFFVGSEI